MLDEANPRHKSFLARFAPGLREYIRNHYREVALDEYESDGAPLSDFHQKVMRLLKGAIDRLADLFHRHGFSRCQKHTLNLGYKLRGIIWRLHDKRVARSKRSTA